MKKIVVLGAGMVGRAMAVDLNSNYDVTSVDRDPLNLKLLKRFGVKTLQADLKKPDNIKKAIKIADLVVIAVPGFMGYKTLKTVIGSGKNVVDISFFDEDPFRLDALAKKKKVIAVVDCGVAPGMGNIIADYWDKRMEVESFDYSAAGLPVERVWPFEYKAPFSPVDVMEIYTRPARHRENGVMVTKPAMSEPEMEKIEGVGTLESFNTDGLRTLLRTTKIPNMKERTLRYPGHIRLIQAFRDSGFFDTKPVRIGSNTIVPVEFTCNILFKNWKLGENDDEFTIMKVIIKGIEKGKNKIITYQVLDYKDKKTGFSSMARTTGFTATAVADLILTGRFNRIGINPPEFVGMKNGCLDIVINYLKTRGVNYQITEE